MIKKAIKRNKGNLILLTATILFFEILAISVGIYYGEFFIKIVQIPIIGLSAIIVFLLFVISVDIVSERLNKKK